MTRYGFGFYRSHSTNSVGVWFGVGQLDFRKWMVSLNWGNKPFESGGQMINYPRHWWSIGRLAK